MTWIAPDTDSLWKASAATWPPAAIQRIGPWIIRRGDGGGSRVSAASLAETGREPDDEALVMAEKAMAELGQPPIFSVPADGVALDEALARRGYDVASPTVALVTDARRFERPDPMKAILCSHPLARMSEIWAEGDILAPRLAVMDRAVSPKAYLMARYKDRPSGAAFVACSGDIAFMHALHIRPQNRRVGLGNALTARAANWAAEQGAGTLALLVTRQNAAAIGLYEGMGFEEAGSYHYRVKA